MAGILAAIQAGIPAVLALVKTADKIVVERTGFFVSRFSRLCKNTVWVTFCLPCIWLWHCYFVIFLRLSWYLLPFYAALSQKAARSNFFFYRKIEAVVTINVYNGICSRFTLFSLSLYNFFLRLTLLLLTASFVEIFCIFVLLSTRPITLPPHRCSLFRRSPCPGRTLASRGSVSRRWMDSAVA